MKAVVIDKPGGPEALRYTEDHPVPKLKDTAVLVRTKYSGVNFLDTYFRSGLYPAPQLPLVLGSEGVGEVASTGSANPHNLQEGDTVIWMNQGRSSRFPVRGSSDGQQAPILNTALFRPRSSSKCPMTSCWRTHLAAILWELLH